MGAAFPPSHASARLFARISAPQGELAPALERISAAITAHPFRIAGQRRLDTALMPLVPGLAAGRRRSTAWPGGAVHTAPSGLPSRWKMAASAAPRHAGPAGSPRMGGHAGTAGPGSPKAAQLGGKSGGNGGGPPAPTLNRRLARRVSSCPLK
nr:asparaginase [Deinococcus hopiensis]